jgi:crossover junction endodeoxyribonuclease RusA
MSQTMTLALPRASVINANHRLHYMAKARKTREIRNLAGWAARAQLEPVEGRVRVLCVYQWPDNRRRDAENLAPTSKACIDGLRDAGIFPDDDRRYVVGVDNRQGEKSPTGLLLSITLEAS